MTHGLTTNAMCALRVLVAGMVLTTLSGCDFLFNGTEGDTSLDGNWNVVLASQIVGGTPTTFTLTIANGEPTQIQINAPAPLNIPVTIKLDGVTHNFVVATFMGSGTLTRNDDGSVTVTISVTATYSGQTLSGTLTLTGTLSGNTITGTATGTGTAPGLGIPGGSASTNFTMTKQ